MEQQFKRELQQHVPARGLAGAPPRRTLSEDITVPAGLAVKREAAPDQHGAMIAHKNLGGLDEVRLSFSEILNGVHVEWELKNTESFPVSGRTATLEVALIGVGAGGEEQPVALGFSPTYQAIRQRCLSDFYYDGLVAEWIEDNKIKFSDQTIYMGQALIWLATEAHLRQRLGQDTAATHGLIAQIMAAVDQLDLDAERLFGHPPALDGFIARDNITGPADPRLGGRFQVAESDWQKPENAAPSGDQIFGLLYGLWFIVRLVEDGVLVTRARELSDRIFLHVKDARFVLRLPDGKEVKRGGDLRWLSSLLHGLNFDVTGQDRFDECRIEVLGLPVKLNSVATVWDGAGDQAAQILRSEIDIPGLGKQSINSFAAHILLMAIAPGNVWSKQEFERAALTVNHYFAVLTQTDSNSPLKRTWILWTFLYIMWHEGQQGTKRQQVGGGPGRGLMQFEPATLHDLIKQYVFGPTSGLIKNLAEAAGVLEDDMKKALRQFRDSTTPPKNAWPDGKLEPVATQVEDWVTNIDSFAILLMRYHFRRYSDHRFPPNDPFGSTAIPESDYAGDPQAAAAKRTHARHWVRWWWRKHDLIDIEGVAENNLSAEQRDILNHVKLFEANAQHLDQIAAS